MTEIKEKMYVHVVLDRSGSMLGKKGPTIAAYNSYIDGLPDDAVISLSTFSTGSLRHPRVNVGKTAAKFTADEYECIGGTALRDAIGTTIQMIDTAAKEYDRVALVIQTDGEERDSREFTQEQIKQLLTDKQDGEGWLVVFLGASLEAFQQAQNMGFSGAHAMQYDADQSVAAMASVSRSTQSYNLASNRAEGRQLGSFTSDERDKAK